MLETKCIKQPVKRVAQIIDNHGITCKATTTAYQKLLLKYSCL